MAERDFTIDQKQHDAVEEYWRQMVERIATTHKQKGSWKPWMARRFADGTVIDRQGNPVFECRSQELNRAIRIVLYRPSPGESDVAAWINHDEEDDPEWPRDELVINLSMSPRSLRVAEQLLHSWMDSSSTPDDIRPLIDIANASRA